MKKEQLCEELKKFGYDFYSTKSTFEVIKKKNEERHVVATIDEKRVNSLSCRTTLTSTQVPMSKMVFQAIAEYAGTPLNERVTKKYFNARTKGDNKMYVRMIALSHDDRTNSPVVTLHYCYNRNEAQFFSEEFILEIDKYVSLDYVEL